MTTAADAVSCGRRPLSLSRRRWPRSEYLCLRSDVRRFQLILLPPSETLEFPGRARSATHVPPVPWVTRKTIDRDWTGKNIRQAEGGVAVVRRTCAIRLAPYWTTLITSYPRMGRESAVSWPLRATFGLVPTSDAWKAAVFGKYAIASIRPSPLMSW